MPKKAKRSKKQTVVTPESPTRKRHKYAIWAFVLGVVSIVIPMLLPCAIVALVLGSIAIHQVNKDPEHLRGKGFAIAGVATAGVSFFGGAMMLVAVLVPLVINGDFDDNDDTPDVEKAINIEMIFLPATEESGKSLSFTPSYTPSEEPGRRFSVLTGVALNRGEGEYPILKQERFFNASEYVPISETV
ncbi:MAG: DUF4190 domain-containing protein [Planctomycetota bacterium]|jgi:hypothetical protein